MQLRDLVRHEVADRPALPRPGARTSVDETSIRGISKKRTRSPPRQAARASAHDRLALPARRAPPPPRSPGAAPRSGSCHVRQRRRLVGAEDQEQLVVGRALRAAPRACPTVYDGPSRSISIRETAKAFVAGHGQLAQLVARLGRPGRARSRGAAAWPTGISTTWSSSSCAVASCAQTRCPMCGGLNAPPKIPTSQAALLRPAPGRSPRPRTCRCAARAAPIGPRACSFWVELPISAPIPNSPPSVKRVDAFT